MFTSFFPKPRLLFLSAVAWSALCIAFWYLGGREVGAWFSLGNILGAGYPAELAATADEAAKSAFAAKQETGVYFWLYQLILMAMAGFIAAWRWYSPHPWQMWSIIGSAAILFITWFQVELDVMINDWFGRFYNVLQAALAKPGSVSAGDYYGLLWEFGLLAGISIMVSVFTAFLVSHYVFRWRTAMNDYYVSHWPRLRKVEGASQRVQEDTMRFASITERLGVAFIDSVLTLIAFLPILWGLSAQVKELPIFGAIPQPLVATALIWSAFGTAILAAAGMRLPGLEFRNQRVEAAYRKELVYGEDNANRAAPPTLHELFTEVRKNYFTLFLNYTYFNVVRYGYLQASVIVPYVAMGPAVIAGGLTLGAFQQIVRAFGRVQGSFQFLVNSWPTIVELISIYKRLQAFESTLTGDALGDIEREVPGTDAPAAAQ